MIKNSIRLILILNLIILVSINKGYADDADKNSTSGFQSFSIGGQWFLSYLEGNKSDEITNQFTVNRGYINIKTVLNEYFSGRITPDISLDQEGDGIGSLELRLKYAYLKWNLPDLLFMTNAYFELGLVHRPWLDFEEHINHYRVQGTMFIERNNIINSADFGVTFVTLFGGEIDKDFQNTVNKYYPGKFGSMAIGIYNGGGYHALEVNNNKSIEARITLRPLPQISPGIQLSYNAVYGKGNTFEQPDWIVNMGYLSWVDKHFVFTGTVYKGVGNFHGTAVDSLGNSYDQDGYSLFAEYKIPGWNIGLFGRYDLFRQKRYGTIWQNKRYIVGLAYYFYKQSKFLIDVDLNEEGYFLKEKASRFQISIEIRF